MPTTIEVNKQSVEALLGSGKSKPFVVPEYQRPYAWTDEQVETLFEDLWDFTATSGGTERESSYFLGSVVSYENEDGEQEIIDGQQRITSLFLLLRAIYTKLVAMPASERTAEANNFIGKIEPTIWRTNKLTGMVDFKNILLTSRVVNNEGNEILRSILETGKADEDEPDATIKEKIEHIGNKLPFEKKLNIVAGNGYFGKKKKEYTASKIVITKAMGTSDVMDWNLESITKRDIRVSDEVVKIMNRWNNEYLNIPISEGKMGEPSEEELAQIEKFKKNGWI